MGRKNQSLDSLGVCRPLKRREALVLKSQSHSGTKSTLERQTNMMRIITNLFLVTAIAFSTAYLCAQEILIPDPALNAVIREALQKPVGSLTEQDMLGLTVLNAPNRNISSTVGLEAARNLNTLLLFSNHLTDFSLPTLTNLVALNLSGNALTHVDLPADLGTLRFLDVGGNQLVRLTLPRGLTNLVDLTLNGNQLTNVTLPQDMTRLTSLTLDGNPLTSLVLSEQEAGNLPEPIRTLQGLGIPVFEYPLSVKLKKQIKLEGGAFRFGITGPPGFYNVRSSSNLTSWNELDVVNNALGSVFFLDAADHPSPQVFYSAQLLQDPPAEMVFVPANTFVLGSPTNEVGHRADESPLTVVRLSRGFWISKFLVTQGNYLAVTGSNPSQFPGDLNRPVESVSWFAASNYCALLTQQDFAAGRIPAGTHYRLPTEAEWECAARAGSTTRFYYGDDPNLTNLINHAWLGANSGFTTRPVGKKLPNAWGLYDMEGNVWEWCLDWYGTYPGGVVTDPSGPISSAQGFKVVRGGAWEASELDCRSARRSIEGASPFISDYIIGFRVVLVMDL